MAMKQMVTKPVFSVLIGHRSCMGDACEMMIKFMLEAEYDLRFFRFGDDIGFKLKHRDELLGLTREQHFDLIIVYSYLSLPEERELFASIRAQYGKPIIVSNMGSTERSVVREAGADVLLPELFTVGDFRSALAACGLKPQALAAQKGCPGPESKPPHK